MKPEDKAWQKLVSAAREVRDERDVSAPYGFATRVAAMAMADAQPAGSGVLLERFSWGALAVAALLGVGGVATNYASTSVARADDEGLLDEVAVTAVFDLT